MNREKIGIGIITCNRESYFVDCFKSIDQSKINELVIVNDGQEFTKSTKELVNNSSACYLHNNVNLGVSKTKNKALKYLLKKNCEHIFILEDDCFIKNNNIWKLYIDAYKETHIPHFNYGPASPWNREQQDSSIIGNL
jgi:GT2 family glycosyltransferase